MLITGANAGIGKDVARQLALRPDFKRIYLACRNQDRATAAKAELEAATGRSIFDIILMDVADLDSVRAGLAAINGSLDALVMNAGVIGDKKLMNLTADGVTTLFATNEPLSRNGTWALSGPRNRASARWRHRGRL